MPFDTPDGPAVLITNMCKLPLLSERLGVAPTTVYQWIKQRETKTHFPYPIAHQGGAEYGCFYDYQEIYDWFQAWIKAHPRSYPMAVLEMPS